MIDYGTRHTDLALKRLEARLRAVYRQAEKDIAAKTEDYWKRHAARDEKYRQQVKDGKLSREDYEAWQRGQVFQGKQWESKRQSIEDVLYDADSTAMRMINDGKMDVFTAGANYMGYELEQHGRIDTGFNLYDGPTVTRLLKDDPQILPKARVKKEKAYVWYNKLVNNCVLQGIIQGESINEIAARIGRTTGERTESAMKRNALTAYTGAQNAGRIEGMKQAQQMGIDVKKRWIATMDSRTRDAHRDLDGQVQDVDKPFKSSLGDIMYPGDPKAKPGNVYNCHCAVGSAYPKYPAAMTRRDAETGKVVGDMTYREWEAMKQGGSSSENARAAVIAKLDGADNLFKGHCTSEIKNAVVNALSKDPEMLNIIGDTCDNVTVNWIDAEGTSHLDRVTGEITMFMRSCGDPRDIKDLVGTFWHEYGHYVDYYARDRYKYTPHGIDLSGIRSLVKANGYEQAAADDINAFLKRMRLDDRFVSRYSGGEYSYAWLSRLDGNDITPDDKMALNTALGNWVKEFSGSREAEDYLYNMGYPRRPEYDDFFETYVTPKRQTVKTRERYKGAREAYQQACQRAYEAEDAFRTEHDMGALYAEQEKLRQRVREREDALAFATDTFDGGARGGFFAGIWGGHSPDYYSINDMGAREGIANTFSVLATGNSDGIEAMRDLCPRMYDCMSKVIKGGGQK